MALEQHMTRGKRQDGEGGWTRYRDGWKFSVMVNGQRIYGYGKTKPIAKERALEKAKNTGLRRAPDTVRSLYDEWVEAAPLAYLRNTEYVGLRPGTYDLYRSLLGKYALPVIGKKRVDAVTKRDCASIMRSAGHLASSSQRSLYAALVFLLEMARRDGIVGVNVMRELERPKPGEQKDRNITQTQAQALLAAAEGHEYEIVMWLSLGCGLRRGEILGLKWDHITDGQAFIVDNLTRTSAGLKDGPPKTKAGKRLIPLPTVVQDALKAHRKRQNEARLAAGPKWQDTGYVVTLPNGRPVDPRKMSRVWSGWARKAKVKDHGTHVGRHYAGATQLASGKASAKDVADQMGHDPAMLLKTYAAAVSEGQVGAAEALGATLKPTRRTTGA